MTTPKPLNIVVAINPAAAFGRGALVGPAVEQSLRGGGHTVTALTEPSYADLVEQAGKAIAGKPDAFVVVGGTAWSASAPTCSSAQASRSVSSRPEQATTWHADSASRSATRKPPSSR